MNVLWLCNIALPLFAKELALPVSNKEGWLSGVIDSVLANKEVNKDKNQIELAVCFPNEQEGSLRKGTISGIQYYSFYEKITKEAEYEVSLEATMAEIITDFKPDVIHIFGTEFAHSLAMAKAFRKPERIVVGIQGICSLCAQHYTDYLPHNIINRFLLRDFLKQDNIRQQQKKFELRGQREAALLEKVGHITGRTEFDEAFVKQKHPHAVYHKLNETLRSKFYEETWKLEECEPYTILMSQGDYPLKGLHIALEALAILKKRYPNVRLRVAGNQITKRNTIKEKIKLSSYGKYILDLIKEKELENNVEFMGMLNAEQMCEALKKTNVFLNASFLENSPNSLGEAMLLGVPCVSSYVGGVPSLFTHEQEGYCYQANEPSMLAYYVDNMFLNQEKMLYYSEAAKKRARCTHDPIANFKRLLEVYETIIQGVR